MVKNLNHGTLDKILTNEGVKKLKDGQKNEAWATKRSLHDALVGEGAAQMAAAHHEN